jgi:hypothetical protein
MYDDFLKVDMGVNVRGVTSFSLVAFADDLAVITTGKTTQLLEDTTNLALGSVSEWMKRNGLTLKKLPLYKKRR